MMGLVNRVLPDAELEKYVKDYADTIGGNAPLTVNVGQVSSSAKWSRTKASAT